MRKIILGLVAATAVAAPIALATAPANAVGTPRCQESVVTTSSTTAVFDAIEPREGADIRRVTGSVTCFGPNERAWNARTCRDQYGMA
jgi:hypothetical protein